MKEYLKKYRNHLILMVVSAFLIHGAKLHSEVIGIDTEDLIHLQGDFYGGWLNTGRQGLIALKWLTNSLIFRPYLAGMLTLVVFGLAVSAFFLLWERSALDNRNKQNASECQSDIKGMLPWIAGGLFLMTHPVITEQFYFALQSVEICIGLSLTVVALYLVGRYQENGKKKNLIVSTFLLLITFSTYQIFVVIFIFGTVSVLLLDSIHKMREEENITAEQLLKGILPYLSVFFVSFVVNTVITKTFFSTSDYLNGQILWGKFAVLDNFRAIAEHVKKAMLGYDSVHYHFSFGLLIVMTVVLVIQICFRFGKKKKGIVFLTLFFLVALLMTPFLMTIVCGGAPAVRSQLVLPLTTGFLAYLNVKLFRICYKARILSVCVAAICVVGIWAQLQTTMSLYYTDQMRYEQDAFLGRELILEMQRVAGDKKLPVAVFGRIPFEGNNACIEGEVIGKSFFDYDTEIEPKYYWGTRRVLGFLHTLGADYPQVERSRFGNAKIESDYMPVWPAEGSVQIRDGMLVIKLSEY